MVIDGAQDAASAKLKSRRARWRRNKRAERARKAAPLPAPLDTHLVQSIWTERNRRHENYPHFLWNHPDWHRGRGSFAFQCDVWAVRTLLEAQKHRSPVTAGEVARWLSENDLDHGFQTGSLRTMVYRAFEALKVLETAKRRRAAVPFWPAFSLLSHGSNPKQPAGVAVATRL